MADRPIDFAERRTAAEASRQVWQCACGSTMFWLYRDGNVECRSCEKFMDTMQGYWSIRSAPTGEGELVAFPAAAKGDGDA